MHELGNISDAEYQAARAEPDTVHPYQARVEVDAHYAAEMARAWAIEQYGEDAYTRGLTVVTTINPRTEEHTSEIQSLMRHSHADLRLKIKKNKQYIITSYNSTVSVHQDYSITHQHTNEYSPHNPNYHTT